MTGYAFCASFCTHAGSLRLMRELVARGEEILPIISENTQKFDTRFGKAQDFIREIEKTAGRKSVKNIVEAEPLGAISPLDYMVISPCTGNTLAKIAAGITDSAVTMAAKAHLRCDRPLLIALSTNDAMSQNLSSISSLLMRKSVFFVPMIQDSPRGKPHSLVADTERFMDAYAAMKRGEQLRPLFLTHNAE